MGNGSWKERKSKEEELVGVRDRVVKEVRKYQPAEDFS